VAIAALGATGYGLYRLGQQHGPSAMPSAAVAPATPGASSGALVDPTTWSIPQGEEATRRHMRDGLAAGSVDPVTGRAVLYYHDPMVPGKKFDAPSKSPFMDMMLVPQYAGTDSTDASSVTVSARIQQNLGVRTAEVIKGTLTPQVAAVGNIAWNERDQAVVQARAMGFVEKLYARAALDRIGAGQPMAEIYVPDWVAAQEEFLALRRMQGNNLAPLVDGARARMRQVGMTEQQITSVESTGQVKARFTLRAPLGGVLTEVAAREGMTVSPGMTLFRINGTSTVWAEAEVPESQAALLRPGASVRATSPAVPGQTFDGRVQTVLPEVNAVTRTIKARMELNNRGGRLAPGMFVQMQFLGGQATSSLLVPTEAVIDTGRRKVVMVSEEGGKFRPVDIETGVESGGQTEVRKGLEAGQRVVVSSQFLIDSEASLKGVESRLKPGEAATHRTPAKVEAIQGDMVTLTHPPIPALKWPEMTMDFKLAPAAMPAGGLRMGEQVDIEFQMKDGEVPEIRTLRRSASSTAAGQKP